MKIPKTNTKSQNTKKHKIENPKNKNKIKNYKNMLSGKGVVGSRGPQGTVGTPPLKTKK